MKGLINKYHPGITAIYFIRPGENTFKNKYGLVPSWDEFGIASTAKSWVPKPFIKQLIFEKTGNRQTAEKVLVQSWPSSEAFQKSGKTLSKEILFINLAEEIEK